MVTEALSNYFFGICAAVANNNIPRPFLSNMPNDLVCMLRPLFTILFSLAFIIMLVVMTVTRYTRKKPAFSFIKIMQVCVIPYFVLQGILLVSWYLVTN